MLCANCGIGITGNHYRAGLNGSIYCTKKCGYEAYDGFYTKKEVDKTLVEIKTTLSSAATLEGAERK